MLVGASSGVGGYALGRLNIRPRSFFRRKANAVPTAGDIAGQALKVSEITERMVQALVVEVEGIKTFVVEQARQAQAREEARHAAAQQEQLAALQRRRELLEAPQTTFVGPSRLQGSADAPISAMDLRAMQAEFARRQRAAADQAHAGPAASAALTEAVDPWAAQEGQL